MTLQSNLYSHPVTHKSVIVIADAEGIDIIGLKAGDLPSWIRGKSFGEVCSTELAHS